MGCQTGLTTGKMFVYTIQPVNRLSIQPVNRLYRVYKHSTGCIVYTNIQLVVKLV